MAVTICFTPMILPYHMATKGYVYNIIDGMLYGTLSPIFWGTGIAWAIYTANNGYAGKIMVLVAYTGYFINIAKNIWRHSIRKNKSFENG